MAASPKYKVYNAAGDYRASFKDATEAATLVSVLGEGSTIRFGHSCVLWIEPAYDPQADLSYDVRGQVAMEQESHRD